MAESPFKAYDGDEPFIFVSYSHKDSEIVFPELLQLKSLGFNVWYDEGIKVGQNWTDELAQRLNQCALTIYLVTPSSVLSRHCSNEVHYAIDLEKPMLVVHLRPAALPPGQRMQLGTIQGIIKHELSETEYSAKLTEAVSSLMSAAAIEQNEVTEVGRPVLPMGMVTMLRLDIVGNHELALEYGDRLTDIILRLRHITRETIRSFNGHEIEIQGDVCFVAFSAALNGVLAAIEIQRACQQESWPMGATVKVRMGLHTGQPVLADNRYFGVDVQRAVNIATIAVGGQILMSAATCENLSEQGIPADVTIRDLGSHRLKDMPYPEVLYDLSIPGMDDSFEPIASLTNRPSNLPKALSSFIGRKRELAEITKILRNEGTHILTLTGPGGTGKTRLSIEAARQLEGDFTDGVFMIHLAAVTDPDRVVPAIAETLGVKEYAGQSLLQSLMNRLSGTCTLLVMDNFEQIVEGATELLDLLQGCPNLKLLISSRELLHLQLEKEYHVNPLQLPGTDAALDISQLESVESVQLFIERVREFRQDFTLSEDNARTIADICIKLDGLPLALELAAARLNILSPQGLKENLDRSLDVLKSKSRDLPDRQRTLRSTVEWSYNLLDESERALFRQLSVFSGGFTIPAAQIVLAEYCDSFEIIEGIESLVNKSLLKRDPEQIEPRFWMLETIREYGLNKFDEDPDRQQIKESHSRYFLDLAESLAPGLTGHRQRQCVARLLADSANLGTVMHRSIENNDADLTGRMFQALMWMWIPRGQFTECRLWVKLAMDSFKELEPCRATAVIHETSAWADAMAGDYQAAVPNLEICQDIYSKDGDEADRARTGLLLGVARAEMQIPGGMDLCMAGVDTFQALNNDYYLAMGKISVGIIHLYSGEFLEAIDSLEDALQTFREIGNSYWPGQLLQNLAHFRLQADNWQGAIDLLNESMEIARKFDYPIVANLAIAGMGAVAVVRDKPLEAARLFGSVQASLDKLGVTFEPLDQAEMDKYLAMTRDKLSADSFQAAFHEGSIWNEQETRAAALAIKIL